MKPIDQQERECQMLLKLTCMGDNRAAVELSQRLTKIFADLRENELAGAGGLK